jgi:type IV pilus assembly protein PilW
MGLQRQLADVQDRGRFALWFLKEDLQRAGWSETFHYSSNLTDAAAQKVIFSHINFANEAWCGGNCTADGGGDANDAVTVTYEGLSPGGGPDCAGSNVVGRIQNRYFVNANRELVCQGNGGAGAQVLVSNVDSFQVLYGVDINNDQVVDSYVLPADFATANFGTIYSARFALLLAGEANISVPTQNRTFQVLDRAPQFNDNIPRRLFSITVNFANKLSAVGV